MPPRVLRECFFLPTYGTSGRIYWISRLELKTNGNSFMDGYVATGALRSDRMSGASLSPRRQGG
jgi:hypothetical protein